MKIIKKISFFISYAHEVSIGNEVLTEHNNELDPATVISISTSVMQGN